MSEVYSRPQLIATWSPARGMWETTQTALCGHSEPFLETWPTSGMTQGGTAYALPTLGPVTDDSASSSLPTPRATRGGSNTETVSLLSTPQARDYKGLPGDGFNTACLVRDISLPPTPTARDHKDGQVRREPHRPDDVDTLAWALALLPTPAVNDMGDNKSVEWWDDWTAKQKAVTGNGNGHGKSLAIEAVRLLPTSKASNNENRQSAAYEGDRGNFHGLLKGAAHWGDYADAIARHEQALGRPAPAPTQPSAKGTPQLSPAFVEWMMMWPTGWVTDVPGITRNQALKACGNGVVTPQAEAALRLLLAEVTP